MSAGIWIYSDPPETFGELLRMHRQLLGKTLREVSEATGISVSHLSNMERGTRRPTFQGEWLDLLSRALLIPYNDLAGAALAELSAPRATG